MFRKQSKLAGIPSASADDRAQLDALRPKEVDGGLTEWATRRQAEVTTVFDQAGIAVAVDQHGRPHDGRVNAALWIKTAKINPQDRNPIYRPNYPTNATMLREFRHAWQPKDLPAVLESLIAIADRLVALRLGGWHFGGTFELANFSNYLTVFNPLNDNRSAKVLTGKRNGGVISNSDRKVRRRLAAAAAILAELPDAPLRPDNIELLARLGAIAELTATRDRIPDLVTARWPEANGPVLNLLIARARDLLNSGLTVTAAVEQAGADNVLPVLVTAAAT
jgi:hypothetical protein